jgi:hypothetical protein
MGITQDERNALKSIGMLIFGIIHNAESKTEGLKELTEDYYLLMSVVRKLEGKDE